MKKGSPVSGGISLDDKYLLEQGRAFMTGIQALVRLPLDRKRLDRKLGLNTAGFISGYRGSPLGGYDQQIRVAGKLVTRCAEPYAEGDLVTVQLDMEQHHISFFKNGVLQGAGDGLPGQHAADGPADWCGSRILCS